MLKIPARPQNIAAVIETLFKCKWSLQLLGQIRRGVNRPGAIRMQLPGLTPKVQNHCLQQMILLGILDRTAFPEVPPRVEYALTEMGSKLVGILDAIEELQREVSVGAKSETVNAAPEFTSAAP